MICVKQHNTKTCIICTDVVWLGLPAAIALNYHLALIATWLLCANAGSLIHGAYMTCAQNICNLPRPKENLVRQFMISYTESYWYKMNLSLYLCGL